MACELCALVAGDVKTGQCYRDKNCIIVDCLPCKVPMAVINHHGPATQQEERLMESAIHQLFPGAAIRKETRKIKDHVHWHVLRA